MAESWTPGDDLEFGPIDRGYVMRTPDYRPDDGGGGPRHKVNAYLQNHNQQRVYMWVNEVASDFAMAGTTAQSKHRRQFFPHNFIQPILTFGGQTPNQYEHARLAEFVRKHQNHAIHNDQHLLRLNISGGGGDYRVEKPRNVKGRHDGIRLRGYISMARRSAQTGVNAPPFTFDFIVVDASHLLGLHDDVVRRVKFKDILQIVTQGNRYDFEEGGVLDPDSHDSDPVDFSPFHPEDPESGTGEIPNAILNP